MDLGSYVLVSDPSTVEFTAVISATIALPNLKFICKNRAQRIILEFVSKKLIFLFLILRRYPFGTVLKVLYFGFIFENNYLENLI
jgi:hypothetical protein